MQPLISPPRQEVRELMRHCVGAHDACYEMVGCCPYCEPVFPLRYEDGRFAPYPTLVDEAEQELD